MIAIMQMPRSKSTLHGNKNGNMFHVQIRHLIYDLIIWPSFTVVSMLLMVMRLTMILALCYVTMQHRINRIFSVHPTRPPTAIKSSNKKHTPASNWILPNILAVDFDNVFHNVSSHAYRRHWSASHWRSNESLNSLHQCQGRRSAFPRKRNHCCCVISLIMVVGAFLSLSRKNNWLKEKVRGE